MCIKTKVMKSIMKSKDKHDCMIEVLDIIDKDKRNRGIRTVITIAGAAYTALNLYNLWASQFIMEVPQNVEEHVIGFKPPVKEGDEGNERE